MDIDDSEEKLVIGDAMEKNISKVFNRKIKKKMFDIEDVEEKILEHQQFLEDFEAVKNVGKQLGKFDTNSCCSFDFFS